MSTMANDIRARLVAVEATVEDIRKRFQAPSLSVGVSFGDGHVYTQGFGLADKVKQSTPDAQTIYQIGSCTKAITATALALLAERGMVALELAVSKYLPEFNNDNEPDIGNLLCVQDLLSHCCGLSPMPYEVIVRWGEVIVRDRSLVIPIMRRLPRAADPKTEWRYNNWPFALASILIERISGQSYTTFVEDNIFAVLGMRRTRFTNDAADDNFARNYMVYSDGASELRDPPSLQGGEAFESSGSVRSCITDMLIWTRALINAHAYVPDPNASFLSRMWHRILSSRAEQLTLAMARIQQPQFPLATEVKQSYGLGLFTLQLPTSAIATVTNNALLPQPYTFGEGLLPQNAIGHTGELGGYLTSYWTFPSAKIAVVVLCSSFNINGDVANVVSQTIAQAALNPPHPIDFLNVSNIIISNARTRWDNASAEVGRLRVLNSRPAFLASYEGEYVNAGLRMSVTIKLISTEGSASSTDLELCINGEAAQKFVLEHLAEDKWTFMPGTRDLCLKLGYSVYIEYWPAFIVSFGRVESTDTSGTLFWSLDSDKRVPDVRFDRVDH